MISQTAQYKFNCGGDIIIGKSFDKLVKATDVKVSMKRWCDGSQTPTVRRVWHGLPDGIKPLPEPMLTNHQWGLHPRKTSEEMLKITSLSMNLKLINLRLQLNLSGANDLTHYGLEMATQVWVNIGSNNGLLPDGTKPLPEPMLMYDQLGHVAFTWWQYSMEMLTMSLIKRGLTLVEVSQHAYDYLYIRTTVLFIFLRNSCKPDMVLVYIFVE